MLVQANCSMVNRSSSRIGSLADPRAWRGRTSFNSQRPSADQVEHVHVHEGGQAIVGNVETGGGAAKSEVQSHAQITHAAEPEMRSPLAEERETMPERRDEER